jgi:hypothetical protein
MADPKTDAGEKPVPTNTPEYGCVTDLAAQQAATASPPVTPADEGAPKKKGE